LSSASLLFRFTSMKLLAENNSARTGVFTTKENSDAHALTTQSDGCEDQQTCRLQRAHSHHLSIPVWPTAAMFGTFCY
jgi:hypothetical protein